MMYEVMIPVASFEILPSESILPGMFPDLTEEVPYNDKFERFGFETQYTIFNMGTLFFVFMLNSILLVLYLPLKACSKFSKLAKGFASKIKSVLFFRWWIIFV